MTPMRLSLLGLWILVLTCLPALAEQKVTSQFVRIDEDDKAARLQTTVTRYEKDGVSVDLIGAVHIADRAYYEDLNRRFAGYDVLLFELIGGEKLPKRRAKKKEGGGGDPLNDMFAMMSTAMKLSGQMDVIDYWKDNFVHADLTVAEFERMQEERDESLMGFAVASAIASEKNNPASAMDMGAVMSAMLTGNSNGLKLVLMKSLGQQDDQISQLLGESVIIDDRNAKCFRVMDAQIAAGKKKLGIFYGAAHLPDMEERLRKRGFRKAGETWLTAWYVAKPSEE